MSTNNQWLNSEIPASDQSKNATSTSQTFFSPPVNNNSDFMDFSTTTPISQTWQQNNPSNSGNNNPLVQNLTNPERNVFMGFPG